MKTKNQKKSQAQVNLLTRIPEWSQEVIDYLIDEFRVYAQRIPKKQNKVVGITYSGFVVFVLDKQTDIALQKVFEGLNLYDGLSQGNSIACACVRKEDSTFTHLCAWSGEMDVLIEKFRSAGYSLMVADVTNRGPK